MNYYAGSVDVAEGESGLKKRGVLSPMTLAEDEKLDNSEKISDVSITVVGASGDLAKKKIFPALFALYYENCLPEVLVVYGDIHFIGSISRGNFFFSNKNMIHLQRFSIFGYARSKMIDSELRNMVRGTLSCRIDKR